MIGRTLLQRTRRLAALLALLPLLGGCVHRFWQTTPREIDPAAAASAPAAHIATPVKAHLMDGSTVVFRRGATIQSRQLTGDGEAYPLLGTAASPRSQVPLDSVVGIETFEGKLLATPTVATSVAATAVGALGTLGILKAIFGSCPTVYVDSGGGPVLAAEGFSYAIAPLLEQRDVDPLRLAPDADGMLRLELRNEALETHFLNHVELLAVAHAAGARVMPDQRSAPTVVSDLRPLVRATDRTGRDVRDLLAARDERLFASAAERIEAARPGDLDDWIDIEADGLPPGDSVAVVLRLRNSLLNTVLLYDVILAGPDAPDWLAQGMQNIATAVDVSSWYVQTMGMRATVEGAALDARVSSRSHGRIGDVGPIAFRDVALVLPRPARDAERVRVRLAFVADNWRIDEVLVAGTVVRTQPDVLPLSRVVVPTPAQGAGPVVDSAALRVLHDADGEYLETRPGQRMVLEFAASRQPAGAGERITHLIAWQGWYREWIRGAWLTEPARTSPFMPGDDAVLDALRRWHARRVPFEQEFYASRIPVQ